MTLISSLGSQKRCGNCISVHTTIFHCLFCSLLTPWRKKIHYKGLTLMVKCSKSLGCVVEVSSQLSAGTLEDFFTCLNPTALHPQHPGASAADLNRQCSVLRKRIQKRHLLPVYAHTSRYVCTKGNENIRYLGLFWHILSHWMTNYCMI